MKRIFSIILTLLLLFSLIGCARTEKPSPSMPLESPDIPPMDEGPEEITTELASVSAGKVIYMNRIAEAQSAWEALAARYTVLTGVSVTVLAPGEDYDSALSAALKSGEAPTLFSLNKDSSEELAAQCMDLRSTVLFGESRRPELILRDQSGHAFGLAYWLEPGGLLVNTALLEKAGYTMAELDSFSSLRIIANDIHARSAELGFDAFAAAGLTEDSERRFSETLSGAILYLELLDQQRAAVEEPVKGVYTDAYKDLWDVYNSDAMTTGQALFTSTMADSVAEFGNGSAVFMQGRGRDADVLKADYGLADEQLAYLPLYSSADSSINAGLCLSGRDFWCLNANADEADINATLDFLYWVVTGEEGVAMLCEQFDFCPFRSCAEPRSAFARQLLAYEEEGRFTVPDLYNLVPMDEISHSRLLNGLLVYSRDGGYYPWSSTCSELIRNWNLLLGRAE